MSDVWEFPSTHKFEEDQWVETSEIWPYKVCGKITNKGQRTSKNKKGQTVFDCNSYFIIDNEGKNHYFLEYELQ